MPLDLEEYSVTSFRNMDDLSSNSRVGVSNSATRPAQKNMFHEHFVAVRLYTWYTRLKRLLNNVTTTAVPDSCKEFTKRGIGINNQISPKD